MDMLSDRKQGWQGRAGGIVGTVKEGKNRRRTRSSTQRMGVTPNLPRGKKDKGPVQAPRSHCQFQRDWRRRCHTEKERHAYLRLINAENLPHIFRVEMEPDVMASVLSLIVGDFLSQTGQHGSDDLMSPERMREALTTRSLTSVEHPEGDSFKRAALVEAARTCLNSLQALTKTGRFDLNVQFLPAEQRRALCLVFRGLSLVFIEYCDEDLVEVGLVQKQYGV